MPPRGRKPKPTKLRLVGGNAGHRPLPEDEPEPEPDLPEPPDHLNEIALAEWERIGRQLLDQGLVTQLDRAALAAYCVDYARWAEAERQVLDTGIVLWKDGIPMFNPFIELADKAKKQMLRAAVEFGLSPSSRTRVKSSKPKDTSNPLGEFLGGNSSASKS
jgi:P27 family predicted phage terminase small subunit